MKLNKELIRGEMKRRKITQTAIAKRVGITRQGVHYHLAFKGELTLATVRFWSKALRIPAKDLLII